MKTHKIKRLGTCNASAELKALADGPVAKGKIRARSYLRSNSLWLRPFDVFFFFLFLRDNELKNSSAPVGRYKSGTETLLCTPICLHTCYKGRLPEGEPKGLFDYVIMKV